MARFTTEQYQALLARQMARGRNSVMEGEEAPVAKAQPKRIRQSNKPLMNKLETEYHTILCAHYGSDRVLSQAIRFRLGNGIWYKPDFAVFDELNSMVCYECKGPRAFRGGFENLKVVAGLYPHINFVLVWKDKQTGQWQKQEVLS